MALTAEQIAAIFGAGGTSAGSKPDWRKSLQAFLKNPASLSALQSSAQAQAVTTYDPEMSYLDKEESTKAINRTKQRWKMLGSKYDNLVEDYAAMLKTTGGGPDFQNFLTRMQNEQRDVFAQRYGVDSGELGDIIQILDKDRKSFLTEESRIARENMKAYYKKRRTPGEIMKQSTGVSGLEGLATTPEQLLNVRKKQVADYLAQTVSPRGEKTSANYISQLLKDYEGVIKKQLKGVNPLKYTLPGVVKKTVMEK